MSKPRDLKGFGGGGPSRAVSVHVFMSAVFLFLTIATFLILAAANQTAALWATSGILAGAPAGWIFGSVESRWIASDLLTAELSKAGRRRFLLNFAAVAPFLAGGAFAWVVATVGWQNPLVGAEIGFASFLYAGSMACVSSLALVKTFKRLEAESGRIVWVVSDWLGNAYAIR